jgi:hypothetical protein
VTRLFALILLLTTASSSAAQTPATRAPAPEPSLRRWFEFQQLALSTRYRFIESNADRVTSNDLQYREQIRARFNIDAKKRYTVNAATASGNGFISSWDNTGVGINDGDYHNHYLKQLFVSASPLAGLEFQYGGLGIVKGENTEITSYDDDGYLMGERVSVRRPKAFYVDELSVTRAKIGPTDAPSVHKRWRYLDDPDYTQVLGAKRFSSLLSGSLGYERQTGADIVRGAVAFHFKPTAPIAALRYEQYYRFNQQEAGGFALSVERPITKWVRLNGGFASIDEDYGGLNGDRYFRGNRVFALANIPVHGPFSAQIFFTQAFDADYSISNRTRFDAVFVYDILNSLRQTGVF